MFNQKTLITTAQVWIPLAIVLTVGIGFAYVGVQQNYRTSLNDPQIEVAAQAVDLVKSGQNPTALVPTEPVDMAASLATFIIFYDANGKVAASSGALNGATPTPLAGVFDYTKAHGEDRFTWQPQTKVRVAAVVRQTATGYVLAGRSMREVETRIDSLTNLAAMAWFLGLGLSLAATLALAHFRYRKNT